MTRRFASLFTSLLVGIMLVLLIAASALAQSGSRVTMLNQAGERIATLTDGALVQFTIEVPQPVDSPTTFSFHLDKAANRLADCRIPAGERTCTTISVGTLGWYWDKDEQIAPSHEIHAANAARGRWQPAASLKITVKPRPVVMVHGFGSDYTTWINYLGPSGYLALIGLKGYAVGDGQVEGTMHTGNLLNPSERTNTIALNAAELGKYITNVKAETGAEQVDLIVHSMGGLISRYYIDHLMTQRDVAQLIMLGTPNGGSNCALMVGSLGLYQPAGLELREDYVRNVFNPQITERHGIPFYNFAGTPIALKLFSPCSKTPNDLVVSLDSATATPVELVEVPILHIDLTTSAELFDEHVKPLLRRTFSEYNTQGSQPTRRIDADEEPVQYSQIITGVVTTAEGNTHVINIDSDVSVASFGLYDPSRTLTVTVRGASGNVIALNPARNGITVIDDPESLLYLGYGFENPNPGPWQVTVHAAPNTPPLGTEYAIVTQYVGGATVEATLSNHLPGLGEEVTLNATLNVGGDAVAIEHAQVVLIHPDGRSELIDVAIDGDQVTASWLIEEVGIHGVDISLSATLPDDTLAERTSYLALEAFDEAPEIR